MSVKDNIFITSFYFSYAILMFVNPVLQLPTLFIYTLKNMEEGKFPNSRS